MKNLTLGKVKTRLAATVGDQKALEIYGQLVAHTLKQVSQSGQIALLYFSDDLHSDLPQCDQQFALRLQRGSDLGERMSNAFKDVFETSARKVLIIGTDCPGLNASIIKEAFDALDAHDIVIGPATDGGYYLLGMRNFQGFIFEDIPWSTSEVLELTLETCARHSLTYCLLKELSDIDDENDLDMWNSMQKDDQTGEL
ncbi:TIGR04282 family arsenosugar biosynthesis glycosyltransferase [Dyadobacter fanqingshengii]|uniref:TIGR04282 family arsenosugar biosynthesis glycosyltransferase n=1 Tax=Dyadobacter fanqingshengii TaxID=2906443 RepID=A0A9X1P7W3_9BACT|nr:TIGR04282 family arsenosugar biosynthesis glycosyltransferase [Dyadobacter fanqingshengii]MCF0040419.1 TIGR04282 family arsenosugar biosynthesis glycosyltransferase [Dyadobacter fanqingshengii]USJ37839.1 TIGR04282 family arsenosugar biosynthesis glycosyltransferase [Dyadobacter fanqingshengii]